MKETIFALSLTLILLSPFLYVIYSGVKYIWNARKVKRGLTTEMARTKTEDVDDYCERIRFAIHKIENGVFDETAELFVDMYGADVVVGILKRHLSESEKKNKVI